MLAKLGGIYAPRPSQGPHKLAECVPIAIILRNRLKYALTRREVVAIVMRRLIKVDHKIRTDINFPVGFQDIVTLNKTDENFRLLYDVKGRFVLHRINDKEAKYKLCRVTKRSQANKASIGRNPFQTGHQAVIPYIVTHDGRTIRYPDPLIKVNDTVKLDIETGRVTEYVKFDVGNIAMATRGANIGRVGLITNREKHPGSHEIVHIVDRKGQAFATRIENVFVIGQGDKPMITLPRDKGIQRSIIEERQAKREAASKQASDKKRSTKA